MGVRRSSTRGFGGRCLLGASVVVMLAAGITALPAGATGWAQQAALRADHPAAQDLFGTSVATSASIALVGTPNRSVDGRDFAGSVFLFDRAGSSWNAAGQLEASVPAYGDQFGYSVAFDGDTAVVGAPTHDVGSNVDEGAAYVFEHSDSGWSAAGEITASDGVANDNFGIAVAVSGSTIVVGSQYHSTANVNEIGGAYVFHRGASGWSQQAVLTPRHGMTHEAFGLELAVAGSSVFVGATNATVNDIRSGAVYVYTNGANGWKQRAELTAAEPMLNEGYGGSIAASGSTVMIGYGGTREGAVDVLGLAGGAWTLESTLTIHHGINSSAPIGGAIALSGDTAVLGQSYREHNGMGKPGGALIFTRTASGWAQAAAVKAQGGGMWDEFGRVVAISGSTVVVGAPQYGRGGVGDRIGAAYVFGP